MNVHHALTVSALVGSHTSHSHTVQVAERVFQGASFHVEDEEAGQVGHLSREGNDEGVLEVQLAKLVQL